ncbi:DUF4097 family beta strand repeat-containing protein [Amycolatopsis nigrescens]|uniref:DUF4097 family beta strand repeat-containing protein n=1 Tax=Amycolatopsis nigrescens TaxID=381445 RepID=UPI00036C568D|nr:DUF4097 family beta strand repeat-containing protein [Amycolatopsis nigrescens]
MPTFDTPEPIFVTLELSVGDARITASERSDTVVEVRPTDDFNDADVKATRQTRVEYASGKLLVKMPKQRSLFGRAGSVDVRIELPSGSQLRGNAAVAAFHCDGTFGECRFKTSAGDVTVEETGPLYVHTAAGDVTVDRVAGHAEVTTGTGAVRIRAIDGTAVVKNSNGHTWVGEVTRDLRLSTANGDISVDSAQATVGAKTANGSIRIGEVVRGSVVLGTAVGELEVGIREGTAAWLDLSTQLGTVHNTMDSSGNPEQAAETVEVRARTSFGDIVIHRS